MYLTISTTRGCVLRPVHLKDGNVRASVPEYLIVNALFMLNIAKISSLLSN